MNGRIVVKLVIKKLDVSMWTEVILLRIGFGVKTLGNTVININLS
jgi:hypothetical protein